MDLPLGLLLAAGLLLLLIGAHLLVRGASTLARYFGISPLVIGLTVVALGTSSPEIAVSVAAVFTEGGGTSMAVGNVVGSNIFNGLVVLGSAALIVPLRVDFDLVRFEIPFSIAISLLVLLLAGNGRIGSVEGLFLVTLGIGYLGVVARRAQTGTTTLDAEVAGTSAPTTLRGLLLATGSVLAGLALLVAGSEWMVVDARAIAVRWGVSDLIVGLTVVAAGTSLPELASSLVAVRGGEQEMAVGNAVGSSILNLLFVLGLTASVAPAGLTVGSAALGVDLPVMIACAVAALPIFWTGYEIARWEGSLFFASYGLYVLYLWMRGAEYEGLQEYRWILVVVVLPLTALAIGMSIYRHWIRSRNREIDR